MQQLRGRQHGRDGRVPGHPRQGEGRGRRHHRPVGPDHAEPRGDAARRRRDAARRLLPHQEDPAPDRRRDDEPRPHGGEDRAALRRAGRLRARREPLGRRVQRAAERRARRARTSPSSRPTTRKVREQHANKKQTPLVTLAEARANKTPIDWAAYAPPAPKFIGRRVLKNQDLAEIAEVIDWGPFFQTWDLAGPYPAILNDEIVGESARARVLRRQAHAAPRDRGPLAARQRRRRPLSGDDRRRRRHRDLPRRVAQRRALHLARPARADRAPGGRRREAARTAASPTSSRRRARASTTTSACSRSPPGSASRRRSSSSPPTSTTTARSC